MVPRLRVDHRGAMSTTTPPPAAEQDAPPHPESGPRVTAAEARDLGRLRRSVGDRRLAGVAGGLGQHLDIDPTIIRVAFVVLALFGGSGVLLYVACWVLVPLQGTDRAIVPLDSGVRTIVLGVAAALAVLSLAGHSWGLFGFPWPLALFGLGALAVLALLGDRSPRRTPGGPGAPPTGWVAAAEPERVSLDKEAGAPGGSVAPSWSAAPSRSASPSWSRPPVWSAPTAPRPYRGPRLFLPTIALIALGCGVLGLVDLAGRDVPDAAYPALALALCGAVLVVGAWFGRTGGIILLAVLSGIGLLGAGLVGNGSRGRTVERPLSAVAVAGDYRLGVGDLTVDLTRVSDPQALVGRSIVFHGNVGQITVVVPREVDVTATATVTAVGTVHVFGAVADGNDPSLTRELDGRVTGGAGGGAAAGAAAGPAAGQLTITADLRVGDITVRTD